MSALDLRRNKTTRIIASIQECGCGTRIDVTRFEAFQELICPTCAGKFVVQGQVEGGFAQTIPASVESPEGEGAKWRIPPHWIKPAIIGCTATVLLVGVVVKIRKTLERNRVSPIPEMPSASLAKTPAAGKASSTASSPSVAATATAPGVYKLKNRQTSQVVDVFAWNSNRDAVIKTWPGGTGVNQRWIVRPLGAGYQLVAFHSCKALEAPGGSANEDTHVRQGVLTGADPQIWTFQPVEDGFHRIVAKSNGKALAVLDVEAKSGALVGLRAVDDTHAQQWKLESLGAWPAELNPILEGRPLGNAPAPVAAKKVSKPDGTKFVPISLASVANCDSRTGTFSNPLSLQDTVRPRMTGWIEAGGVVFDVPNVATTSTGADLLILRGGMGPPKSTYPKKVEVAVNGMPLTKLHFLGGVGGWGYPWDKTDKHVGVLAAQVTVVRRGGAQQVLQFRNGIEFADYHARVDVPGSAFVDGFADYQRQARFFSKSLSGTQPVEKLIIESFETNIAPVFVAITGEVAR